MRNKPKSGGGSSSSAAPSWLSGAIATALGVAATALAIRSAVRSRRRFDFRGKVVLITGGSRGFGLDLSRRFIREGVRLAICARDADELARAKAELSTHARVLTIVADVAKRNDCQRLLRDVESQLGPIDILVNNAGVIQVGPIETMTREDFDESMAIHYQGPLELILGVLPGMQGRRCGRIVNITSIGGKVPMPHLVPYCAGKFALVGLSESLRTELTKHNIYVTTVVPGLMRTGGPHHALAKGQHEKEFAWFATADVMPVLSMDPARLARDVVEACRYGDAAVIRPLTAYLQVLGHGIAPGITMEAATLFDRALPQAGGIGTARRRGFESDSSLQPRFARERNKAAAERHNEMPS